MFLFRCCCCSFWYLHVVVFPCDCFSVSSVSSVSSASCYFCRSLLLLLLWLRLLVVVVMVATAVAVMLMVVLVLALVLALVLLVALVLLPKRMLPLSMKAVVGRVGLCSGLSWGRAVRYEIALRHWADMKAAMLFRLYVFAGAYLRHYWKAWLA